MLDEMFISPPKKESHRTKRFRTYSIPINYMAQFDPDDIQSIASQIDDWATMLVDVLTMPNPAASGTMPVPNDAKAALHSATYYGTMLSIREMSLTSAMTKETEKPIGMALAAAALNGAIMASSNYEGCQTTVVAKANINAIAHHMMDNHATTITARQPFDSDAKADSKISVAMDEVEGLNQRIDGLLEELAESRRELAKKNNALMRLERKLDKTVKDHEHTLSERDDRIKALEKLVAASDDRINKAQQQADAAIKDAQSQTARTKLAREQFLDKLNALDTMPDMTSISNNPWRDMLINSDLVHFKSATDVIQACQSVYLNELSFSQKAIKDAADYDGNPDEMWKLLSTLVDVFLPTCRDGRPMESRMFQDKTNMGLSSNESETTKSNKRMVKQRTATMDGKIVTATHHAKGSSIKAGQSLRVYFSYNETSKKLQIIRCGDHLETAGSKKRGY